jgi:hypothetical protein
MKLFCKGAIAVFVCVLLSAFMAKAQLLGTSASNAKTTTTTATVKTSSTATAKNSAATAKPLDEEELELDEDGRYFIPEPDIRQIDRPTLDGVKRGNTSITPLSADEGVEVKDDELIFLYYRDFQIRKNMGGRVSCKVSFILTTTLNRKLANISMRLIWPGLETSLSYDSVEPNQETAFNYVLVGEGCFNMDKMPNIVVNRCRVKGLTQQQCASKIRWLTKKN